MSKSGYILYTTLCFLLLAVLSIGIIFQGGGENAEKRSLAQRPTLFRAGAINLEFSSEAENYINDHFAFRSKFVSANSALHYFVLGESTSEKVIAGKQGMLFFAETEDDYLGENLLTDRQIERLIRIWSLMKEATDEYEIGFWIAIAPNKASLYGENMPWRYVPVSKERNLLRVKAAAERAGIHWLDLESALRKEKEKGVPLYYEKDSHWNSLAAALVAQEMLAVWPEGSVKDLPKFSVEQSESWSGDLAGMLLPDLELQETEYHLTGLASYSFPRPVTRMDEMEIQTRSQANDTALLMYRDSFANNLIPILSGSFGEALYTRAQPYPHHLAIDYDGVILEIAERNIPKLLERAPMMEAPLREEAPLEPKTVAAGKTEAYVREGVYFYHVFGRLDEGLVLEDEALVWAMIDGQWREAFPVLEASLVSEEGASASEQSAGYSFYTETDPGETLTLLVVSKGEAKQLSLPLAWIEEEEAT